jgi:hypothetical protein
MKVRPTRKIVFSQSELLYDAQICCHNIPESICLLDQLFNTATDASRGK